MQTEKARQETPHTKDTTRPTSKTPSDKRRQGRTTDKKANADTHRHLEGTDVEEAEARDRQRHRELKRKSTRGRAVMVYKRDPSEAKTTNADEGTPGMHTSRSASRRQQAHTESNRSAGQNVRKRKGQQKESEKELETSERD